MVTNDEKMNFFFVMKLTMIIMIVCLLEVSASVGYGQDITLNVKNTSLIEVFASIKRQTGYTVFYKWDHIKEAKPVTVNLSSVSLERALSSVLKGQNLDFAIDERTIVIRKIEKNVLGRVKDFFSEDEARQRQIRGSVSDTTGVRLPGATVRVKDTDIEVITDEYGNFMLEGVLEGAVLQIRMLGFETLEVPVAGRESIQIVLKVSLSPLDEVQVIAYGTSTKRFNTGSVGTVKSETIEKQPVGNVLNALKGAIPGLDVRQSTGASGAAVRFNIRGLNSLNGDNEPFILVDGVPMSVVNFGNTFGGFGGYSALNVINPSDIESVEVLKDADATAIYGSRGANGVILITTKKGKAGKTEVGVNISDGIGNVSTKMKMLNTRDYLDMRYEAFANDGVDWRASTVSAPDLKLWDTTRYTDWQKELIGGTARYTNAQLSLSGGNAFTSFSFSGNHWRETTVYPGDFANNRFSGRFSFNHRSTNDRLRFTLTTLYGYDFNEYPTASVLDAYRLPPNAPSVYAADGSLNWEGGSWDNPLAFLLKTSEMATHNLNASGKISYRILKNLSVKIDLGYGRIDNDLTVLEPRASINPFAFNVESKASFIDTRGESWNIEPYLEYEQKIWKGKLSALLGTTFQERTNTSSGVNGRNFTDDALIRNPAAAETITHTSSNVLYRYNAVFGRLNYNVMDRYILNLTGRRDGSSRFGPGRQFGNFGAVGAAWIFSEEEFVKKSLPFLSFGKLRGSYGTTGSDAIGDYSYLPTYSVVFVGKGLIPGGLYNPIYAWESNSKFDAAIELGFKDDGILLSTNYYNNRSSNQLVGIPMPAQVGFSSLHGNLDATVQNTGWEFSLNTVNVKGENFLWRTTANFTIPKNKLIEYPNLETSTHATSYAVGYSLSLQKTYDFVGVSPQTGLNVYRDRNGKDTSFMNTNFFTQADQVVMINTVPHYYGGLTNSLEYKGITLDFTIQYSKRTRNNDIATLSGSVPGMANNIPVYVFENSWRKPGDAALFQKFTQATNTPTYRSRTTAVSEAYYMDVELLRLNNVSLSWKLPALWQEKLHAQRARVYVLAQNLLTFSNFKGVDPEAGTTGLPLLRVVTAGVQISF